MGLFKNNSETDAEKHSRAAEKKAALEEKREVAFAKKHEKAKSVLLKKGYNLNGLLLIDDSFDDGSYEYLLVFSDRVEYLSTGKVSTITRKGKSSEIIPISKISSIQSHRKVLWEVVEIGTTGTKIEFKSTFVMAPKIKQLVLELMSGQEGSRTEGDLSDDIATKIKKLADLHQAGIITDDEFQSKKTDLLNRM